MPVVEIEDLGAFHCGDDDTVMRAALRAGVAFPYACNTGSCGNCRFQLVSGRIEHRRPDAPAWNDRDRARGRWLGCQARPLDDCRIRVRPSKDGPPLHRPTRMRVTMTDVVPVSHDISEFTFSLDGPDAFLPGQYALFQLDGVEGPRAYSMCNLPGTGEWRFQVKRVPGGAATGVLFDSLRPGAHVALDGPYGHGYLRPEEPGDLLLVAGGSGLSPMLSIARAAAADPVLSQRTIRFFYGGRRPEDLCAERHLRTLAGFGRSIVLVDAVSEPVAGWNGLQGFVHEVVRECLGDRIPGHEAYFAGPPPMVQAMQRMLYEAGLEPDRMHFDEFF